MNWLKNLWQTGNLGTVETDVEIETESVIKVALATVIVAAIIILFIKFSKK